MGALDKTDPEIAALIREEERFQLESLRLIPSENYASAAVLEGAGSVLPNHYSGPPANQAVYYALLEPGDTIMGLALPHGGHLTHGWNVSFSARFYHPVQYSVDQKSSLIDYDALRELARKERPKIIVAGGTAYPRRVALHALGGD